MSVSTDARLLLEVIRGLDDAVRADDAVDDLDAGLAALDALDDANKQLADVRRYFSDRLGTAMGKKRHTVEGLASFARTPRREHSAPKCIDEEGLWKLVQDHVYRDPTTGEIVSGIDLIVRVYGSESKETGKVRLTGASVSKLEAVGIPWDLFFEKSDRVGWNVKAER